MWDRKELTRLCDAGADGSSLKSGTGQIKSLLETLDRLKLHVAEALGGFCQFVLDDSHICHTAASEEVGDVVGRRFE